SYIRSLFNASRNFSFHLSTQTIELRSMTNYLNKKCEQRKETRKPSMTKKILVERWQKLAGILKEETVDEAQFAADPMKNIDTMWQPMGDEDYEPAEGEPMMVGSV